MTHDLLVAVATDPRQFRGHLLIDSDGEPKRLGHAMDDWQRRDFEALDLSWRRVAGRLAGEAAVAPHKAYLERPRGHSKTADIAVMVLWVLLSSVRKISGVAGAKDRDQAAYLREKAHALLQLNPWLAQAIEVQRTAIVNKFTGSRLDIIPADAAGAYGLTPDFIVVDELTHWPKNDLWVSLVSAMPKRSHCLMVIITNAGTNAGTSWQWKVRENAQADQDCYFSRLDGPQASWMTRARIDAMAGELRAAKGAFARLFLNQWQRGGDALDAADVDACFKADLGPMRGDEPGYSFLAGLDLGVSNDHAALVVLGCYGGQLERREEMIPLIARDGRTAQSVASQQRVRLALCKSWAPSPTTGKVDLIEVERFCLQVARQFSLQKLLYDPHQAALMAQRLGRAGVWLEEVPFVGQNLNRMATAVLNIFASRQIDLYPDELLQRDLLRLSIEEKSYGFKLESISDADGHADRAIALAICLPAAMDLASQDTETIIELDGLLGGSAMEYQSRRAANGLQTCGLWPR